jgi:hypothetical protein
MIGLFPADKSATQPKPRRPAEPIEKTTMETSRPRKPLVEQFRLDVADGFLMGGVLGSAYHLVNGGIEAVYENVPRFSCYTAVLFGVYEAIHYAMVSARGKEKPVLNCAVAMAVANGIAALPNGILYACTSALMGGAVGGVLTAVHSLVENRLRNRSQQAGDPSLPVSTACPTPTV